MYIDPIILTQRQISSEIVKQTDDEIVYEIQHQLGIDIDKEELLKALNYDRNQYNVGYSDGKRAGYQEALEKIIEKCAEDSAWPFSHDCTIEEARDIKRYAKSLLEQFVESEET